MIDSLPEVKNKILLKVEEAKRLIPNDYVPNLPPGKYTKDEPNWHDFEHKIWKIGEDIRIMLVNRKSLRRDENLQKEYIIVATNRNAKRDRQSFIMLLGFKDCSHHANEVVSQIDDPFVSGQVIVTLNKMRVNGFVDQVRPFLNSKITWIRNEAKKYLLKFGHDSK